MSMIYVSLMILIGLAGIWIGSIGIIFGLVVDDQSWGWEVILGSFIYMLHPSLIYWTYKKKHQTLAIGLSSLSLICSVLLVIFLF